MALFNLFSWSKKMEEGTAAACGTACGAARQTGRNICGMWHGLRSGGQTGRNTCGMWHSLRSGGQVAHVTTVM